MMAGVNTVIARYVLGYLASIEYCRFMFNFE